MSVIGDVEDICNARLTFENGCVANITASRLALKTERKLRVFSADAYVSLDYQKKYGIVAPAHAATSTPSATRSTQIRPGEIEDLSQLNFAELVNVEELQIDDIEPLPRRARKLRLGRQPPHPPRGHRRRRPGRRRDAMRIVAAMGQQAVGASLERRTFRVPPAPAPGCGWRSTPASR